MMKSLPFALLVWSVSLAALPQQPAVQRNGTVVVRVIDMKLGTPIVGARVWIGEQPDPDPMDPPTDADGKWQKKGLPAGRTVIVNYRKVKYEQYPDHASVVADGAIHDVTLIKRDENNEYYRALGAIIRVLAEKAGVAAKDVYAREWLRLTALPDDQLKLVGGELVKTAKPGDLTSIPITPRNMRMLAKLPSTPSDR